MDLTYQITNIHMKLVDVALSGEEIANAQDGSSQCKELNLLRSKEQLKDTKLGTLLDLFEAYLQLRIPPEVIAIDEIEALGHIVLTLVSLGCEDTMTFQPSELWNLIETIVEHLCWPSHVTKEITSKYGDSLVCLMFDHGSCVKASYFGEFLYFCTTLNKHPHSPVNKMLSTSSKEEINLIRELSMSLKPELGIWIFILMRNWLTNLQRNGKKKCVEILYKGDMESKHRLSESYKLSLASVEELDDLLPYLTKILIFFYTPAAATPWCFNTTKVFNDIFFGNLDPMSLDDHNLYLINTLRYCLEFLLFIYEDKDHNENLNLEDFKKLSVFFERDQRRYGSSNFEGVSDSLSEISQLMEFLLFDNFNKGFTDVYFKLCEDISGVFNEQYSSRDDAELRRQFLFPFFLLNV